MASIVNSVYDVVGAFQVAEGQGFLGPDRIWHPEHSRNSTQAEFVKLLPAIMPYLDQLKADGLLDALASWSAAEVNAWFKSRGLDIQLKDQQRPNVFYAGSVYEQLIHWAIEGESVCLNAQNGSSYWAVKMEEGIDFYRLPGSEFPVVSISTTGPDRVFMMLLDAPPRTPFGLLRLTATTESKLEEQFGFTEVAFPMVDLNLKTDVSWIKELWTVNQNGDRARVIEAHQQAILKVNHKGARATSGFGMSMALEAYHPDRPFVINSPFAFWVSRPGLPLPLFSAWIDYTEWNDPGELE